MEKIAREILEIANRIAASGKPGAKPCLKKLRSAMTHLDKAQMEFVDAVDLFPEVEGNKKHEQMKKRMKAIENTFNETWNKLDFESTKMEDYLKGLK